MSSRKRAWVDDEDEKAQQQLAPFHKSSHAKPQWAVTDAQRAEDAQHAPAEDRSDDDAMDPGEALLQQAQQKNKRFRSEDLQTLLSRSEPLVERRSDKQRSVVPTVLSVLPLPHDAAKTIHWHRNGQLVIVSGDHHVYTFYASGQFVELLSKVDVRQRLEHTALTGDGEEVVLVHHETYVPSLLNLSTEQVTRLSFLDFRDTAVHRNNRRDHSKKDFYIQAVVTAYDAPSQPGGLAAGSRLIAAAAGSSVMVGSLASGSITHKIASEAPVTALSFSGPHELTVAAGAKLSVYDVRKTAKCVRSFVDEGALSVTAFATSEAGTAVGSTSGIVNYYTKGMSSEVYRDLWAAPATAAAGAAPAASAFNATPKPHRAYKNMTTAIHTVCFGRNSHQDVVLAFSTKGQKSGFRLAVLPEGNVLPSFPAVKHHHDFIQSLCIAPTVPVLSVGEKRKVTNYAL
ncbi:U3 small nucleolar RNA-associated protein 18 [Strigomonas culicis]|uniref:U3 small nucleolar RNA-associated protein 18 n=1 Tax=Strigomonas culicis TaxID=28005 RepID=S9VED2_9TRYP|nr:U3 small nucleolar RNA-associated protein 18 [Strigomonas culicis]|eukprot:EPY21485.1 U3 small nucleolar RNA-associated protein 18 [Strigomonas culicis]